ncbi:MAG: DNA polymerase Y family protein [Lautropia sp.]
MLWIGLYLPQMPLDVFERTRLTTGDTTGDATGGATIDAMIASGTATADGSALAIVDQHRILHANAAALARGVSAGQKRATALSLAPALLLRERDVLREREALHGIACWALQFTPRVSLREPDAHSDLSGLLLDVEASLRLFGGLDALLARLRAGVAALGFDVRIACAPTATASWLFARWQDGLVARTPLQLEQRLADLPLGLLDGLQARRATIESIGLARFRELARLPRTGLSRRFGKAVLLEMDMACGRQSEVLPWFEAPPVFASTLELLADVDTAQALAFAARRLLLVLCGWLAARHAAVRMFVLEARHDRGRRGHGPRTTRIEARFTSPAYDVDRMLGLLRERLATTTLPSPVHALHLRCDDVVERPSSAGRLFPAPASNEESLGRLIERLQARLGHDQVQRIAIAEDHRPEAAYRVEPLDDASKPAPVLRTARPTDDTGQPGDAGPARFVACIPRPLWLLPDPLPLAERQQRPWWQGPLKLLAGPERIEGGWWDDHLVQRDYFIAESDQSQWVWIYRTRGGEASHRSGDTGSRDDAPNRWYLQGIFG